MAGDWIKTRSDLHEDPSVERIAALTGLDVFAVVGRLIRLWSWADQQSRDGHVQYVTCVTLDTKVCHAGFAESMQKVGWLVVESDGVCFPKFDRHNGKPAKERALAKDRKASQRERDETVTREEKRREEIKPNNHQPPPKVEATGTNPPPRAAFSIKAPPERVQSLAALCTANRIERATAGSPYVQQWAAEGVSDDMVRDAIAEARRQKPMPQSIPIAYMLPIVSRIFEASPARVNAEAMRLIDEREAREAHATH